MLIPNIASWLALRKSNVDSHKLNNYKVIPKYKVNMNSLRTFIISMKCSSINFRYTLQNYNILTARSFNKICIGQMNKTTN